MEFKFRLGTVLFFGKDCLQKNQIELINMGKRALIVTGKNSAKLSGALSDVTDILSNNEISYEIYDRVCNNPTTENIDEGAEVSRKFKADFIIGIGGGSPLDASKAIAVLSSNNIKATDLFNNSYKNKMLPLVCIPTTAGTGSEVTPYSIITCKDICSKKSFGNDNTFPTKSFLDPKYTESMSYDVTVNTAIDTLSHALESYINKKSTPLSEIFAIETIKILGESFTKLLENRIDYDLREKLLYASMLGGMAISQSGTTIVHGMGYSLTYFKQMPHGRANGVLLKEFLKFNYSDAGEKIDIALQIMKIKDIDELGKIIDTMFGEKFVLTEDEIKKFSDISASQDRASTSIKDVCIANYISIYEKSSKG